MFAKFQPWPWLRSPIGLWGHGRAWLGGDDLPCMAHRYSSSPLGARPAMRLRVAAKLVARATAVGLRPENQSGWRPARLSWIGTGTAHPIRTSASTWCCTSAGTAGSADFMRAITRIPGAASSPWLAVPPAGATGVAHTASPKPCACTTLSATADQISATADQTGRIFLPIGGGDDQGRAESIDLGDCLHLLVASHLGPYRPQETDEGEDTCVTQHPSASGATRLLAPILRHLLGWDDFFESMAGILAEFIGLGLLIGLYAEVVWPGDDDGFFFLYD